MSETFELGALFPPAEEERWRELAEKILKGRSVDTLVSRTLDGLEIQPLYTAPDDDIDVGMPGLESYTRGAEPVGGWAVRQLHATPGVDAANEAILTDLERGVTEILLDLDAIGVGSVDELDRLLDGVLVDLAPLALAPSIHGAAHAEWLEAIWDRREVPASARSGVLGADPLGVLAHDGALLRSLDDELDALAELAQRTSTTPARAVTVDTVAYAQSGASDGFEIAAGLATAVAYLRAMTAAGLSVDDAAAQIEFRFSAGADQFATIAQARAARRCFARVVEASGGSTADLSIRQNAVTSPSMFAARDPWVNMLRSTVAAFAAGVAGATSVTVLPFDHALGVSDAFARRCARNTQLLLLEESNLGRVADPAGGSWYVEARTDGLANAAWERFVSIESAGGMAEFLTSGAARAAIDETWTQRLARLSTRRDPLTGVSEFPDIDAVALERPTAPQRSVPADVAVSIEPLPVRRPAGVFEDLGARAVALDTPATVFLANLGPIAQHTARSTWAKNFFEIAGIRALGNDGFETADEAAEAFTSSGARLAVIASSDARYGDDVASVAPALRAAGAERIYLAGNPGDKRDVFVSAGVDEFIHVGCDSVEILSKALDLLKGDAR